MFHTSFFLSHSILAEYIQIKCKIFQTWCPKTKKTHLFTIKHPRVLKIAITSLILATDKCFIPHFSCLTLNLLEISKSCAKYFRQGVQKSKNTLFTIKPPRVLKIALKSLILVTDKCFTSHFSCLTLNLLDISKSCAKHFRQGVQKLKNTLFYYKTP